MKKGFTLIEVIAVIVVLAVISLITVQVVTGIIQKINIKNFELRMNNVERVAEMYAVNNYLFNSIEENEEYVLPVSELKSYLSGTTEVMEGEAVIVKKINGLLYYYYTERDKNPYTANETLKNIVEANIGSSHLTTRSVNGTSVTKVIGSKSDKTTIKNWVWYSGQLWQVLETTSTYVKLVTANSVTSISYGTTNTWSSSWVRKWLNEVDSNSTQDGIYYHNLSRTDILLTGNFCLDEPSNIVITSGKVTSFTTIGTCASVSTDKIGLLTFEDYIYALNGTVSGSNGGSFLDEDERNFTITKHGTTNQLWSTTYDDASFITYNTSSVATTNGYGQGVRPVIYLSSDLLVDENSDSNYGTATNPYILSANIVRNEGETLNSASVGSYLFIDESNSPSTDPASYVTSRISYTYDKTKVRYRIIGINSDGTIKIQRADILRGLASNISNIWGIYVAYYYEAGTCEYGVSTTGCAMHNYFQPTQGSGTYNYTDGENLGYYLNNTSNGYYTWLSNAVKENLALATWNLAVDSYGEDYTRSFNTDTSGTYPTRINDGIIEAYVGLPSWGDMFCANDINAGYWLLNRKVDTEDLTTYVSAEGETGYYFTMGSNMIRPVLTLQSDVTVSSGDGTIADPYILNLN